MYLQVAMSAAPRRNRLQHLIPVNVPPQTDSHSIKYYVVSEEPKEYVCERGCVHVFVPIDKPKSHKNLSPQYAVKSASVHKFSSNIMNPTRSISSRLITPDKSLDHMRQPTSPIPTPKFMPFVNLGSPRSSTHRRNPCKVIRNSSDDDITPRMQVEKLYDRNEDVFTRLYPFKSTAESEEKNEKNATKTSEVPIKMNWINYHRLDVIHNFLDDLEYQFPSLCTVGTIGESLEGRALKILKISNGNATNSAIWIDAGIHAREWIGPAVNTYIANYIARNFDKLPSSCTNKDWYFMPVVNPDGYEYTHTNNRMWRKNRAWHNGKCVGVDLNRNFSFAWGGKGSSDDPSHCFYRGTGPFSEPESCALKEILLEARIPFKVYITLHAFGEVIIFPFACSDNLCPDYVRLLSGATVMSRAIYETNGTTYKVGISKDVMYRASGTSNDWCYGAVGIPYCYLIELRSKKHRFKLPHEEIEETGNEILNCVKALMNFVDNYPTEIHNINPKD